MAIRRRKFFEDINGVDDEVHWLALDDETGHILVISGYLPRDEGLYEIQTELAEFIVKAPDTIRTELFAFLATLFDEEREGDFVWRRTWV